MYPHFKTESGSATILEYAIVLPIVITIILSMLYIGFVMYQNALLEAASAKVVLYYTKTASNPNYAAFVTMDTHKEQNEIASIQIRSSQVRQDPYRYIFQKNGQLTEAEEWLYAYFSQNQFFFQVRPILSVQQKGNRLTAELQAEYTIPVVWLDLGLPVLTLKAKKTAFVSDPAELIRNSDFAIDIVGELWEKFQGSAAGQKLMGLYETIQKNISFFSQ